MRVTFAPGAVRFSTVFVRPISGSVSYTHLAGHVCQGLLVARDQPQLVGHLPRI